MPGMDETENEFRYRLKEPGGYDPDSFRYKEITDGVSFVFGCPKGHFKDGKCDVAVEPQAVRFDKKKFNKSDAQKWIDDHKDKVGSLQASTVTASANGTGQSFPLTWKASIKAQDMKDIGTDPSLAMVAKHFPQAKILELEGVAIDDTKNANGWAVDKAELENIAEQFNSGRIQMRVDHSKEVGKVIGRIMSAKVDGNRVTFNARIISSNPDILIPILSGDVDHSSIQADARFTNCSQCGQSMLPLKKCRCKGSYPIIAGLTVKEQSVIADPAYETAEFRATPVGFCASVNNKVAEVVRMTAEEEEKKTQEEKTAEEKKAAKKAEEERKAKKAQEEEEKDDGKDDDEEDPEAKKAKKALSEMKAENSVLKAKIAELEKTKKAGRSAARTQDANGNPTITVDGQDVRPNPSLLDAGTQDVFRIFASKGILPVQVPEPQIMQELRAQQEAQNAQNGQK